MMRPGLLLFSSLAACQLLAVDAEVRRVGGLPALCFDGEPVPPLLCVTANPNAHAAVRDGSLQLGSNSLFSGTGIATLQSLPADCDIEAEVAFDSQVGTDASFGFAFKRGGGEFTCNLAYYPDGNRLKFWDRGAGGKGLIRWDRPLAWELGRFYRLRLEVRGRQVKAFVDGKLLATKESPADSKPGRLRIGIYRGEGRCRSIQVTRPDGTAFMTESFDDPALPAWDARAGSDYDLLAKAAQNGIHLFQVGFHLSEFWRGPEQFDLGMFASRMRSALKGDPEAHVIIRLRLAPPPFWGKAHPGEKVQGKNLDGSDRAPHRWANFASSVWRADLQRVLGELVRRIDREEWAGRLIGFQIMAADGGEYVYSFNRTTFHDYSPAQQREFRVWLRREYATDAALRKAWGDTEVTLDTAVIPLPAVRAHRAVWPELSGNPPPSPTRPRTNRIFLDPSRDHALLDYKRFHNRAISEMILLAAKALKSASEQKRVVGVYYGYHVPTTGSIHNKGHSDLAHLLSSPLVDILACPLNYDQRDAGGTTLPQLAPASVRANGKLFWIEDDSRTVYSREGIRWRIPTLGATEEIMKRTFAYALTKGGGEWWLDFGNRWFSHPPLLKLYGQFARTIGAATPAARTSAAQIVVLLQDQTYLRLLRNPAFSEPLVYRQLLEECSRLGAPFDIAMLADLERLPPYRLYVFPDALYVSPKERQMLQRVLRRDNRTALWIYAPGLWTEQGLSAAAASELTGIRLRQTEISALPDLRLTDLSAPWTKWLSPAFRHTATARLDPVVCVDDPEATELGRMVLRFPLTAGGGGAAVQPREVALAARKFDDWSSVYCAVPCLPAELLRGIARAAGVHLYGNGGDTVYASQGFLAIHTGRAGERTLRLPKGVRELREVFDGTRLPVANGEVQVTLDFGQTRLWRLVR
ncbi:MAG: hypothetical protein HN380_12020 [Victivallales bacterium]|nr:hypothetical protein [Victivallales bacterium]